MEHNREELMASLSIVRQASTNQDFIPILSCFCFNGKSVYCYNDVIAIRVPHPHKGFSLGVSAKTLYDLLSGVSSDVVNITAYDDHVGVKAGRTRVKLPFISTDYFLFKFPAIGKLRSSTLRGAALNRFLENLQLCLVSAGENPHHASQMGVTFNTVSGKLAMYSTNNTSISAARMKWGGGEAFNNIILPTQFCRALLATFSAKPFKQLALYLGKDFFVAVTDTQVEMVSKLVPNPNPLDFEEVVADNLPDGVRDLYSPISDRLRALFDRTRLLLSSQELATLDVKDNTVTLQSEGKAGLMRDSVVLKAHGGSDLRAQVDPEMVRAAMAVCDKALFLSHCIVLSKGGTFTHLISMRSSSE